MIEEWRDVVGYEGLYMISSHGRVLSLPRTVVRGDGGLYPVTGRILKPALEPKGYLTVGLSRDGSNKRSVRVHRLVLAAFVGPCPPGWEACHEDDVKTDNRLWKLRWGTKSDNARDKVRNGRHNEARKTHCERLGHEFTPENTYVKADGGRQCRECQRAANRAFKARQRAKAKREVA